MVLRARGALKGNKPMLIEFWANWCPPCLVMDAEVYTNASVIQAMTKVVPGRVPRKRTRLSKFTRPHVRRPGSAEADPALEIHAAPRT